ncbi:MAG: PolC-type DNA polymerase III [Lachnospiraceae bacterium]|nr:PolC-type DNA polymerase III [Lachnospiraceae bacterium]
MKPFFDVFPDFEPPSELKSYFEYVSVERIVMHKKSNTLMIHMHSTRLIDRIHTWRMERCIRETFFKKAYIKIRFHETYSLSSQYDLEKLTQEYWGSFLFEWKGKSLLLYNIMKHAVWHVEDNVLTLVLEDSFLTKSKADEMRNFYESIYKERFGLSIHVGFDYQDADSEAFQKERDHKLAVEAESIFERAKDHEEQQEIKEKKQINKSSGSTYQQRRANNKDPNLIYGRNCDGDTMPISEIVEEIGEVVIRGKILEMETREIRNEKTIIMFAITDFTDTIKCKIFVKNIDLPDILDLLVKGNFYRVKGMALYDKFDHEVSITSVVGIKSIPSFVVEREDTSLEKRVELHMHTVMSDMDSVVGIKDVIMRAKKWGHKAIAITDHGVLQAFPIANHVLPKDDPFKIIYGVEGYFVDDLKELVINENGQKLTDRFVVFDIETTGFHAGNDKIIEIGAVKIENGKEVEYFSEFINPQIPIPFKIEQLTGINDEMLENAPLINEILPQFLEFCRDSVLVAHNAEFDTGFIKEKAAQLSLEYDFTVVDTLPLARVLLTDIAKFTLDNVCKHLNIKLENHHRAVDDAGATARAFVQFIKMLEEQDIHDLKGINNLGAVSADIIKKSRAYHGIILVQNETGRVNLNRLVSASHLDYFNRRPRMPKSLIQKYREGLILGSACEAGELYQALLSQKSEEEIARIVSFYDYLEIQPTGNNMFMIESDRIENVNSVEDIENLNRKIVELGEKFNKPVLATCDVHFLDPEDELYRRILMAGKGFKDADNQAPLYFRTTEEMLKEFAYLGSEKAKEVVITNTNNIADQIERVSPVHPDKCPPVIENSDEQLREICYTKAHEIYGPELPEIVVERLERELHSIISNGFAVMYIIAQRLVWDSVDHGYLVGSRGSVGSSFAATMSGITEVNPLPAHYICPNCYYVDFDSEKVKPYVQMGRSGCDMPDEVCPKCGHSLNKEGHDIPFETFLGFKGDKEPDIDLNFSGDYQSKAHAYVEVIFGKGTAYRAGTIGTLAEKTARGYVYKYFEERDIHKRQCELSRIAAGCTGVKRTTGQHPGGIIVVPHGREIYEFTAIQHPANDINSPIVTTHFEYHSIDHNLLKLDILGHDDPTMIRYLEDLTGIKATTVALDDPDVMSLFHSTKALGIEPEDIGGIPLGSLGVPEFGTDFVIQMLIDTKPKSFSDLIRISGLSHGTDVWLGNAQALIEEGKAEISSCICTRDDIMTYLINRGMEKGLSFTIMESVRKGKGLKPEWEEEMKKYDVPDWYIWSCKKIKYMFPKAHAAAYVMMAWRIAWYKVFHPLAYYAAFFSIRASAFSYELMCFGKEKLEEHLNALLKMPKDQTTKKEQDLIRDMRIVQEMYARGFEFMPLDVYRAKDKYFQIIDGKLMPSFSSIDGMGEKAAEQAMIAAQDGSYTSIENFRDRTKVSKTIADKMKELGILKDLPESDQLTFDFLL